MSKAELAARLSEAGATVLALIPDNANVVEAEGNIHETEAQGRRVIQLSFYMAYQDE